MDPSATQQILVTAILVLALVLFVTNWFRFDLAAVIILTLLVLPSGFGEDYRLIEPHMALRGFANQSIMILACIFVIARALQKTGLSDSIAVKLQQLTEGKERYLFVSLLLLVGGLSAFINNTTVTAMAIPVVLRCYSRVGENPARVYLPLAYISLVGGVMTLIGTTTNITVDGVLEEYNRQPLAMFTMFPAGAVFTVLAGLALFFFAPFFLRRQEGQESLFGKYDVKEFISEILVKADSSIVGRPLQELHFGHEYDITIVGLVRDGKTLFQPPPSLAIREGDVMMVQGGVENIISLRKEQRLELVNEIRVELGTLRSLDLVMAELVLLPNSSFIGQSIRDLDLRDHFGVTVLAFSRGGLKRVENLADIPLQLGDTLMIQGHVTGIDRLRRHPNLLVLETFDRPLTHPRLPMALGILAALVVLCTIAPDVLFLNFLLAVLALLATRCISLRDVYRAIDWRILVLVGCLLPLGHAVRENGLVDHIHKVIPVGAPNLVLLAALYLATFALTQVISNVAAAALMTPIALDLASGQRVDHMPLVMAVAFAASFAFITPFGHQACTLVMGPGNYRTSDYLRLGAFLGVFLFVAALFVIPYFFPF